MQAAFRSTVESFQSALGLLIPETTVAYLDNLDTASHWGIFQDPRSYPLWIQYFLAPARKVNVFRLFC